MKYEIKEIENGFLLRIPKSNQMQETYYEEEYFKDFLELWNELGKRINEEGIDSTYGIVIKNNS